MSLVGGIEYPLPFTQGKIMKNLFLVFIVSVFLVGCGSSRIMLNADIPESQAITIEITTQDNETVE